MRKTSGAFANAGAEERLLCRLCDMALSGEVPHTPLKASEIDWRRFVALVRRHRVAPLVARVLLQGAAIQPPPWVIEHFQEEEAENGLNSLRLASELIAVVDALAAEGIASLPLKGICLAVRSYGDMALRHAGDIDVLVSPDDLVASDRIVRALGCTRISNKTHEAVPESFVENAAFIHHLCYGTPTGALLELHFSLCPNPKLLPLDVRAAVASGPRVRIGNRQLPALPDAFQFVFLATHGARHKWRRLQWVCDIAAITQGRSAGELDLWLTEAARYGLRNPALQALVMTSRLFDRPLPTGIAKAFGRSLPARYLVRQAELTIFRSLQDAPDKSAAGLDIGVRLYRMCLTARPGYHWNEMWRGMQSVWARATRSGEA